MPAKPAIYILPSEALDADAIASALLFAELWQILSQIQAQGSAPDDDLRHLHDAHSDKQLICFLSLLEPEELLWRKDIEHILRFISTRSGHTFNSLQTLEHLFQQAGCHLYFRTAHPELADDDAIILLDRHQLPAEWLLEWSELQPGKQLEGRVIAIWDHRPDSGALPHTPLRCVRQATSCASLLLQRAQQYSGFDSLSEAACLFALSAMHLDRQQYDGLLPFESTIWQDLQQRLIRLLPAPAAVDQMLDATGQNCREAETEHLSVNREDDILLHPSQLSAEQLRQLQAEILLQRDEPDLSLYQQANSDVKIVTLQPSAQLHFRTAVGVVPAPPQEFQSLYESGELDSFVHSCLERQNADFLVILHRQSPQNPRRCISYFFYTTKNIDKENEHNKVAWQWQQPNIDFFITEFMQLFACKSIYLGASAQGNKSSGMHNQLLQLEQLEQQLSRKAFLPAFQQAMEKLLQRSGSLPL